LQVLALKPINAFGWFFENITPKCTPLFHLFKSSNYILPPENGYKISFIYFFLLGKNAKRPMEIEQTQPFKKTKQKK
jgi:hypothetical protein